MIRATPADRLGGLLGSPRLLTRPKPLPVQSRRFHLSEAPSRTQLRRARRSVARSVGEDGWRAAQDVAEKTRHSALAEEIESLVVSKWLEGQVADLRDFEAFFRATEASDVPAGRGEAAEEAAEETWLKPLSAPLPRGHGRALRARAAQEGIRVFDLGEGDHPSEAAAWLEREGFVVLAGCLAAPSLRRLRHLSAKLLHRAARAEPRGNRGERRYSLGRTTMVPGTLELSQSPEVCRVLEAFWGSPDFFVQCTGGDASFPGAKQQDLHADVPVKEVADQLYNYLDPAHPERKFMELPTPVVKVYFPVVDLDDEAGPPRFAKGTHKLTAQMDVPPPSQEPPTSRAFCPAGSAIIMDMRVWHGGTANTSAAARPMLSVHYAGPSYSEDVLKDGGSIPFFGTCYWCYHQGAASLDQIQRLSPRGQELCRHLAAPEGRICCAQCSAPVHPGRSALRSIGAPGGPWLCLSCWAAQKRSLLPT
ncbi:unnamed protein product [Symbiodinium natans]|uniref:Uncharacterized protein n=1 Tax=Symbiodinium natans TaxID=878477 RepID=A0A812QTJ1_9DINO|nr:unnamed protein product [Symbiodinium natans]